MRKLLILLLLLIALPAHAQLGQNQILPSWAFGDGVVVSTSTSPTAKLGAVATSSLGLPTFADLSSYLTLSAWYATTTDALDEGSTNLYYTNGRVQTFLDTIAKGYFFATTSADYWLTTKSTTNLSEGTNLYYTLARWASALAGTTTDALVEGTTNQYFTTARARSALSATYPILYSSGTGVISTAISTSTGDWGGTFDGQEGTYYLARANHTGTQTASTISDFSTAVNTTISASTTVAKATPTNGNVLLGDGTNWQSVATSSLGFTAPDLSGYLSLASWYATTTDGLDEGLANIYYTTARVNTDAPNVTLAGTPDYITIAGQVITRGLIDLATDVTGVLPSANVSTTTLNINSDNVIQGATNLFNQTHTGDATGATALTLATVNGNVGTFGSATQAPALTVNGKGLITAVSNTTITPAVGSITGLGTGVSTALGVNVGTAGAFVVNGGALGTPSSGTLTNATGLPLTGITGGTTGQTLYHNGTNWTASSTIFQASNMNVGFGTTATTLGNYVFLGHTAGTPTSLLVQAPTDATTTQTCMRVINSAFPSPNVSAGTCLTESSGDAGFYYTNIGTTIYGANGNTEVPFIIKTATEKMRILATSGNVGIATTTPDSKLTVSGDVMITGALKDSAYSAGTSGMVLKSTGTGTGWVATSTLGILIDDVRGMATGIITWLKTPSSANLATAVTDETGSGALVFGTSPAFTTGLSTPAITTASGALTVTPAAGSDLSVNLSTTGDFVVNTDDFFVDTSAGRIGVGTVLPTQTFDIETNENANSIFLLKNSSSTAASAAGVIRVSADTALTQVIAHGTGRTISRYGITLGGWSEIAPSAGNGMILGTINATPLVFGTNSNATEAMRITTGNFIGIGTTTPAWLVSIQSGSDTNILALKDSDGQCLHNPESASETVTCSSDIKLKKNIADYDKALDYLNVYKVRKYTVKASGDVLVGAIAQEVQKVHPETVRDMKDGTLGVDVPSAWILVAGIQELNALHEQDVARITELENRVKALDGKEATPPVPVESKIPWASVATVVGGLGAGFVGSKIGKKK